MLNRFRWIGQQPKSSQLIPGTLELKSKDTSNCKIDLLLMKSRISKKKKKKEKERNLKDWQLMTLQKSSLNARGVWWLRAKGSATLLL